MELWLEEVAEFPTPIFQPFIGQEHQKETLDPISNLGCTDSRILHLAHAPILVSYPILVPISYPISDIHCGSHMF